jgi:hypothetical protein
MSIMRLNITPEVENVLLELKVIFPLLSDTELVKLSLSTFYTNVSNKQNSFLPTNPVNNFVKWHNSLPSKLASPEEEKSILAGYQSLQKEKGFQGNTEEVFDWLDK